MLKFSEWDNLQAKTVQIQNVLESFNDFKEAGLELLVQMAQDKV